MVKRIEGICPICGQEIEVIVSAYKSYPFIDGKRYSEICWPCACVPKTWEILKNYDDGYCLHDEYVKCYYTFDKDRLCSVQEMMEDGFPKVVADRSIKAVKKAIKRGDSENQSGIIRHVVTIPPGYGQKFPYPKEVDGIGGKEDMSKHRSKHGKKRGNKVKVTKGTKLGTRPVLVRTVELREIVAKA